MSLVEQRKFNPSTDVMDEIPRTYYPGRGFLSDQEAYPTDLYGNVRPPFSPGLMLAGRYGDLMATNYTQPSLSPDTQQDIDSYNRLKQKPAGASFDPSQLNVQPKIQPGDPGYDPFRLERDRDRFILNNPRSGVAKLPYYGGPMNPTLMPYYPGQDYGGVQKLAEMPRFIRGNYRPGGVFGSPPPNLDSPYMDEQIRRGFVPMTPPVRRPGPQLPGFV